MVDRGTAAFSGTCKRPGVVSALGFQDQQHRVVTPFDLQTRKLLLHLLQFFPACWYCAPVTEKLHSLDQYFTGNLTQINRLTTRFQPHARIPGSNRFLY